MTIDWQALHGSFFRDARILVTGGAGFIGSHLCEALLLQGARVIALDDLSGGSFANIKSLEKIDFDQGSILDQNLLARCAAGCKYIFHLAALGSVPRSVHEPRLFHEVNCTGTLNVLQVALDAKVSRVMFAASSSAYGSNPVPWSESMPVLPCSPYAATKVAGEAMLRAFSSSYGLDTVSLRYFNIFGPRQNANSAYAAVIAAFARSLLNGEQPVIFGDGEQSRDFTFVWNAVHANLLAARQSEKLAGTVLNVGCGNRISVNDLAREMAQLVGRPELQPIHKPERAGDLKHSFADLSKSRQTISYSPVASFQAGLQMTLDWYRSQQDAAKK